MGSPLSELKKLYGKYVMFPPHMFTKEDWFKKKGDFSVDRLKQWCRARSMVGFCMEGFNSIILGTHVKVSEYIIVTHSGLHRYLVDSFQDPRKNEKAWLSPARLHCGQERSHKIVKSMRGYVFMDQTWYERLDIPKLIEEERKGIAKDSEADMKTEDMRGTEGGNRHE